MKNEYGFELDHNGYAPSIFDVEDENGNNRCYLCHRTTGKLDRHEIFGASNREKSKRLGLWVYLCPDCHTGPCGVHRNAILMAMMHRHGQEEAMAYYNWRRKEFVRQFGKNYQEE